MLRETKMSQSNTRIAVNVRFPRELLRQCRRMAIEEGISFSELVRRILHEYRRYHIKRRGRRKTTSL
jgi:predicted DNA binding CopG/RHH family protein